MGKETMNKEWEFPLEISQADIYYIYPFVLDFQLLKHPRHKDSPLEIWTSEQFKWIKNLHVLREAFPLKKGLPNSRLGYPFLLPYKALRDGFGHCEWAQNSQVELIDENGKVQISGEPVTVSKTFIVRRCGNGCLTYRLHLGDENTKRENQNVGHLLQSVIQLVPRLKDSKALNIKGGIFGEKCQSLFAHTRDKLEELEEKLKLCFGKDEGKLKENIWEDKEVLYIDENEGKLWGLDPCIQPFAFVVLYLKGQKYNYDYIRSWHEYLKERRLESRDKAEEIARYLLAIRYQFQSLEHYWMFPPHRADLLDHNRTLTVKHMTCFFHSSSVLAVVDDSEKDDEAVKGKKLVEAYFLPAILKSVENAVSRAHFAFILDGLVDNLIRDISAASFDKLPLYSEKLAKAKSQVAMFLQNIGQYIKGGYWGSEILTILDEVLKLGILEHKLLEKIKLATDSMLDYTRYQFSKLYEEED